MTIERSFVRHVGGWIAINQMVGTPEGFVTLHNHFAPLFIAKGSEMLRIFLRRSSWGLSTISQMLIDEFVARQDVYDISLTGHPTTSNDVNALLLVHHSRSVQFERIWFPNLLRSTQEQRDAEYLTALDAQRSNASSIGIRKPV